MTLRLSPNLLAEGTRKSQSFTVMYISPPYIHLILWPTFLQRPSISSPFTIPFFVYLSCVLALCYNIRVLENSLLLISSYFTIALFFKKRILSYSLQSPFYFISCSGFLRSVNVLSWLSEAVLASAGTFHHGVTCHLFCSVMGYILPHVSGSVPDSQMASYLFDS